MKAIGLVLLMSAVSAQTLSVPISPTTPIDFLQLQAPDGRFAMTVGPTTNPGDSTRPDTAMTWGWNTTADGGRFSSSDSALMFRVENYYKPTTGGSSYMEAHLQYVSASGHVLRPWAFQITRETDFVYQQVLADAFNYLASNGTQYVKWVAGQQMLMNGMAVISYTNGAQPFRQARANGSVASLINLDTSDKVHVGDQAHGAGDVVVDAPALELGGQTGVTGSGSSCTITAITGGLVTGAVCVP